MIHKVARLTVETNLADGDTSTKFQATSIDKGKLAPIPIGVAIEAVARGSRHIFNNGDALAKHAIKKSGFSDIWATHDGNKRLHLAPPPFPDLYSMVGILE